MTATFDIDGLMAHLAQVSAGPVPTPPPPLREVTRRPSKLDGPVEYVCAEGGEQVRLGAWIDGIQHERVLTMVHHRPIIAQCLSGVALGPDLAPLAERFVPRVVASEADRGWLSRRVPSDFIATVADGDEASIAGAASRLAAQTRRDLERIVSHQVVPMADGLIVVDGPLTGHPPLPKVAGVVKSHPCAYLTPETHLHALQVGETTDPPFEILTEDAEPTGRYGSYLRLHDHTRSGVLHGLVRVETHDRALNPSLAATCLNHRQWSAKQDPRWPVHLYPFAAVERFARTRIPVSWR